MKCGLLSPLFVQSLILQRRSAELTAEACSRHVRKLYFSRTSPAHLVGMPMNVVIRVVTAALLLVTSLLLAEPLVAQEEKKTSGNPVFEGWYADPEGVIFGDPYWIYPTYSAPYDEQMFLDCFSSPDLVTWTKHPRILDTDDIKWARRAMWAPSIIEKDGKYYLFFGANDIQNDRATAGIGVAVADKPAGPFKDHLGKPLIDKFHNGASRSTSSCSRTPTAPTT